ncbi:hypothetical protein CEXT_332441 [Caerostris extrusa]|uniref:Uncharacterized protein n=1 Tax=Caerostris extrusa TaxID=172846 RepID=A0AAV4QYK1_CAEEX|nr:hypothetical protein CEXT_332441 [Caerostris extrusa]
MIDYISMNNCFPIQKIKQRQKQAQSTYACCKGTRTKNFLRLQKRVCKVHSQLPTGSRRCPLTSFESSQRKPLPVCLKKQHNQKEVDEV